MGDRSQRRPAGGPIQGAMNWPWSRSRASEVWRQVPRGAQRFAARDLTCVLGPLVDLSESGMRVRHEGRPGLRRGDLCVFTVESGKQSVRVQGRVAWVRRTSWSEFQMGIAFEDVRPGIRVALAQLARWGTIRLDRSVERTAGCTGEEAATAAVEVVDLYAIVGVKNDATPEEIRRAYHARAKETHPDTCKEADAAERFDELNKAFKVLCVPKLRSMYDDMRKRAA